MSQTNATTTAPTTATATAPSSSKSRGRRHNNNNNNSSSSNQNAAAGGNNRSQQPGGGGGGGGGRRNGASDGGNNGTNNADEAKRKNAAPETTTTSAASETDEASGGGENCVVCFKTVEIFSIGECDHPVCYECSTRMRVLCKQNECPICRTDLAKVIFTVEVLSYRQLEINNRTGLYDKKHRICFATQKSQEAYNKLLESPCTICNQDFANFSALREHVKKKHERFYCDICTANLSIFGFERRSYTRVDLGIHRRKGDADDKSHRGHPLCEYCDVRFFDRDELYKHLRREHFYCFICDADGANCYYADYAALRVHFKADHFLCEDGDCAQEQFTAVFRSEIDLRAHIASVHSSGLSRQAARQNRTLDFEITLAPRAAGGNSGGGGAGGGGAGANGPRGGYRDTQHEFDLPSANAHGANHHHGGHQAQQTLQQAPQRTIDARNENEFPSLGGGTAVAPFTLQPLVRAYGGTRGIARTLDNFPALGGAAAGAGAATPATGAQSSAYKKSASALLKGANASAALNTAPARSSTTSASAKRPDVTRAQDFPSLGGSGSAGAAATVTTAAGRGKKPVSSLFDDDEYVPVPQYSASLSAKHRSLANGYETESLSGGAESTKLNVVKRDALDAPKKSAPTAVNVPKISSKANFPTLGNTPSAAMAAQWVSLGTAKKAPVESRKSKVAPAPLLAATKKPAGQPDAKKSTTTTAATKPTAAPPKPKQKNYNPFETDSDEEADRFAQPSSAIMSALSSKHRGLVDSYESVAKSGGTKLALVQQPQQQTVASPSRAAPKLSSADMFPSLGGGGGSISVVKVPHPPANNNRNGGTTAARAAPPPGFALTAAPPPPGFQKLAAAAGHRYEYRAPPNSARRNQALFAHVQAIADDLVVKTFKHVSQMFITDTYKPEPYYEHCKCALAGCFEELFPELLALLPDIGKQQDLYLVHSQHVSPATRPTGTKPKKRNTNHNNNNTTAEVSGLEVCATCKQVLVCSDLIAHVQSHALENNFPQLSLGQGAGAVSSAWKK